MLYPGGPLPLRIFEPRYVDMVSDRLRRDAPFIVALIRSGSEVGAAAPPPHSVGDPGPHRGLEPAGTTGCSGIVALGGRRARVLDTETRPDGLCVASARVLDDEPAGRGAGRAPPAGGAAPRPVRFSSSPATVTSPRTSRTRAGSATGLSELLPMPLARKQHLLEIDDPLLRLGEIAEVVKALAESGEG